MGRRSALLPAFVFGVALIPTSAKATVMVPLSIEDMAQQAACVVRGRVLSSNASWDDSRQRIYTYTEIEVLDAIHSAASLPKTIVVRTLGGEVGKIGMRVSGTEKFVIDEEVVIFLRKDPVDQTRFQTVGMSQGKFNVEVDARGRVAVPTAEGLAYARPDANGTLKVSEDAPIPAKLTLDELKTRVKTAVQAKTPATQVPLSPQNSQQTPAVTR
jgi:hypothetical protein